MAKHIETKEALVQPMTAQGDLKWKKEINSDYSHSIQQSEAIGKLYHYPTHTVICVYHHINWFRKLMIKICFGLKYESIDKN